MLEAFKKYLENKATFTTEEMALILSVGVIKRLRKHQYLLQQGESWRYNAFICEGCLRTYSVDDKGAERIIHFAIENWWAGDRESLLTGKPARFNIDAVEDSVVLLFTSENFEMLKDKIPAFKNIVSQLLDKSLAVSQSRIHASISQTAEEKYLNFLHNSPHIANRIPQHMIASYLGISAETLSRVRKQLNKK